MGLGLIDWESVFDTSVLYYYKHYDIGRDLYLLQA